jgi:hypothetical protein
MPFRRSGVDRQNPEVSATPHPDPPPQGSHKGGGGATPSYVPKPIARKPYEAPCRPGRLDAAHGALTAAARPGPR